MIYFSPANAGGTVYKWMDVFIDECRKLGCHIDYLATHLYSSGNAKHDMDVLKKAYDTYGLKIWLTEFGVHNEDDEDEIIKYIEDFLPRLENADFIAKYSWFYSRFPENHNHDGSWWLDSNNNLFDPDGYELTKVGKAYDQPWHLEKYKPKYIFG